jgi:cell wall-associated NlpC family hydrolase
MTARVWWDKEVQDFTLSLVGTPWDETGSTRKGVYCVGLVCLWYDFFGVTVPNPRTQDPQDVNAHLSNYFSLFRGDCRAGDVVTMAGDGDFFEGHVGIWTPLGVLHATRKTGVVLEAEKRLKIRRSYRYRECIR